MTTAELPPSEQLALKGINSYAEGAAFGMQALKDYPDHVHLLEDMERLTLDRDAQGVLRGALWSLPGRARVVTWTTASGGEERVEFRGGVIMVANRGLADLPELRALADRIPVHRLEATEAELAAQMRDFARRGFDRSGKGMIDPETCLEIAAYLIGECHAQDCPLSLRLYDNACLQYLQWEQHHSSCHWHDLVAAWVRESASHFRHEVCFLNRDERLDREREIVREILRQTDDAAEQVRLFTERTKRKKSSFYKRKREVESGEFDV